MKRIERTHGALIAARYSTDNQSDDSIEIQIEKCTAFCRERGWPVLDIYADYAVSGMKQHRTQLDRMLEDLRSGKGDTVVILDQSRMMRNMPQWFALRQEISGMGVQVASVTQPFVGGDLRDPNTFLMEGQTAIVNHMWVLLTRQKVLAKMHHMAQQGQHTGGKPALGYRVQRDTLPNGELGPGYLVVDEQEAAIVRRIFTEYDSGKSYKAIIDGLNADGIKTKRGGSFGANSLHDLMKNEKYIGTLVYGSKVYRPDGSRNSHAPEGTDVVRIENAIPAIIEPELFQRVQERMGENRRAQGGRPPVSREYPLKGKVYCGSCGSAMYARASRGAAGNATYHYYACSRKKSGRDDCENKPIRVDELEAFVLKYVRALMGNPALLQETIDKVNSASRQATEAGAARMTALIDQQYNIDAQISNIVNAIAEGAFSQALSARLTALEAEKAKVAANIASLKKAADLASLSASELQEAIMGIVDRAKRDDASVFSIVTRVDVFPDKIVVYTLFDPDDRRKLTDADRAVVETLGTPSGVPTVFITAIGLGVVVKR